MSTRQRLGLVAAAVIVAVVAFIVLQGDDKKSSPKPATTTPSGTTAPAKPTIQTIQIKGGKAVGGIQKLEANKGDTVRFQVKTDARHEIHLHGYDIAKIATPKKPAVYSFKANADGIFEIEIEETSTQIAELTVNP